MWWACVIITGFDNGIAKVEEKGSNGSWYKTTMNADLG